MLFRHIQIKFEVIYFNVELLLSTTYIYDFLCCKKFKEIQDRGLKDSVNRLVRLQLVILNFPVTKVVLLLLL